MKYQALTKRDLKYIWKRLDEINEKITAREERLQEDLECQDMTENEHACCTDAILNLSELGERIGDVMSQLNKTANA